MTDKNGNPTTSRATLVKAVASVAPDYDVMMHVRAIEAGEYSLATLIEDAPAFYTFDGYAHEKELMDSM